MKVGDLVRNMHTGEVFIITNSTPLSPDTDIYDTGLGDDYVEVDSQWLVPKDHLEVLNESR